VDTLCAHFFQRWWGGTTPQEASKNANIEITTEIISSFKLIESGQPPSQPDNRYTLAPTYAGADELWPSRPGGISINAVIDQPVFLFSTKNGIIIYLHLGNNPGCYLVIIPNLPIEHQYAYAQH